MRDYGWWRDVLQDEPLPAAVVDLDRVDRNIDAIVAATARHEVTVRPATKSIRHIGLLKYIMRRGGDLFAGLMTFSARECLWLADHGFDDLLMGYPIGRRDEADALAELAERGVTARATVDSVEQLDLLSRAARARGVTIPLCVDIDCSWRPLGGRVHLGVRRSPVRGAAAALVIARSIADTPGVRFDALLAYEAQVAGMQDDNRVRRHLDPIKRFIKARSRPLVAQRRRAIVAALRADGHALKLVNGGGTGSVSWTSTDPSVSEVTVGSGFLCPHTFDGYRGIGLEPAAFFALSVVRRSDADHITVAGGGYVASGAPGVDRLPLVHLPKGVDPLVETEGFGEVQTPFKVAPGALQLRPGDPVICRHAKAGELAERFAEYLLVRRDGVVDRQPTYRGQGATFM